MELNIFSSTAPVSLDPSVLWDSVIIGGGPAGYNAALYMIRTGLSPLLLIGDRGGQVALTSDIENYLGFESIGGTDLVENFHKHTTSFDVCAKIRPCSQNDYLF